MSRVTSYPAAEAHGIRLLSNTTIRAKNPVRGSSAAAIAFSRLGAEIKPTPPWLYLHILRHASYGDVVAGGASLFIGQPSVHSRI